MRQALSRPCTAAACRLRVGRARRWLLATIVVLGLLCGVSFSASYQLVANFANKCTISLGLGCVASGLVVLGLETALRIGPSPAHWQLVVLFQACAGAPPATRRQRWHCLPDPPHWARSRTATDRGLRPVSCGSAAARVLQRSCAQATSGCQMRMRLHLPQPTTTKPGPVDPPEAPAHSRPAAGLGVQRAWVRQRNACAGVILVGAAASASLLLRHWDAVEAHAAHRAAQAEAAAAACDSRPPQESAEAPALQEPLLSQVHPCKLASEMPMP